MCVDNDDDSAAAADCAPAQEITQEGGRPVSPTNTLGRSTELGAVQTKICNLGTATVVWWLTA